jgi:hypothetical protein
LDPTKDVTLEFLGALRQSIIVKVLEPTVSTCRQFIFYFIFLVQFCCIQLIHVLRVWIPF